MGVGWRDEWGGRGRSKRIPKGFSNLDGLLLKFQVKSTATRLFFSTKHLPGDSRKEI